MTPWLRSILLAACTSLCLTACSAASHPDAGSRATFFADENPDLLSAWGVYTVSTGSIKLNAGVVPYDLNSTLFTDYAHKLRTIWLPDGESGKYRAADDPDFPVGTVISKTFYYPRPASSDAAFDGRVEKSVQPSGEIDPALGDLSSVRLIETRLLVRRTAGWSALTYVWKDDQSDATLKKIGDVQSLTLVDSDGSEINFAYVVPNTNQCEGCHATNNTTREISPLGVRPRHLNKEFAYDQGSMNQIDYLAMIGYLKDAVPSASAPRSADWTDTSLPLDVRAGAYLDINCSHCHNPVGPADTSGLFLTLDTPPGASSGLCKLPIAAGAGTGGRRYDIVPGDPDHSVLPYRMETTAPGSMMPELGRSLPHKEAVALIRDWIGQMEGECITSH